MPRTKISGGRRSKGFDFTAAMRDVCVDMVARLPELSHIDIARVAVSVNQARRNVSHGIYASLTPLRFESGARQRVMNGKRYGVTPLLDASGEEYLYLLSFYLPRFLNTSLEEKLSTILHELWHIGPQFDGDLRRHAGRCYVHGSSKRDYDAQMDTLAQKWLSLAPATHLYEFLESTFAELAQEHGAVVGTHWPTPALVPQANGKVKEFSPRR